MATREGVFITLEGIEGSGKSTQAAKLRDFLVARGLDVVVTREPGGSPIAEKIRKILLDPSNKKMVPLAELFLYEASRTQHVAEIIAPALRAGKCVVCDRFFDASTAYQGAARGIDTAAVERLNLLATGGLVPDLTIVLDLDPETGLKRLGRSPDRLESESLEFHRRVRRGYLELAAREPGRVKVVDASGTIDDINVRIEQLMEAWLASRK
ncbi:MAG TPA: dTMP kinase [bacterium]|nr:dTMP kinase [bacterium]